MRPRPRQIDYSKPFLIAESLDTFRSAEGQEQDVNCTQSKIITPDMVVTKPTIKQDLKSIAPHNVREDLIKYKVPIHPDGMQYELNEEDVRMLELLNEKMPTKVSVDDMEQFLALIDQKSGKDIIIEFSTLLNIVPRSQFPRTLQSLHSDHIEKLYTYWKGLREQHKRPLLRALMYPYIEDTNANLAFRPRNQPSDRTMRTRRPTQNSRGISEMELLGQKIVQLRKDMNVALSLIDQCVQREKGFEMDRRVQFCKFTKEIVDNHKRKNDQSQEGVRYWQKDCFIREPGEKCAISIMNRMDEMFECIGKDIHEWRDENERQRREYQQKDNQIKKYEQVIDDVLKDKVKPMPITEDIDVPKYSKPIVPMSPPKNPIVDDQTDSVGRFIATLYMEAKKHEITFDMVMNETQKLKEVPDSIKKKKQPQSAEDQPNQVKSMLNYGLLYQEGSDLLYRVLPGQTMPYHENHRYFWEGYQDLTPANSLHKQYEHFRNKVNDMMEMADTDQMLFYQSLDEDKHEEEEIKQFRKKIKLSQNRGVAVAINGNGSQHRY